MNIVLNKKKCFSTDQLKYHTQIHVRSSRGRNAVGRKVSGIEPMPGEDKILVTSNDSRIRLYDLRDLNVSCKYKGKGNVFVFSVVFYNPKLILNRLCKYEQPNQREL